MAPKPITISMTRFADFVVTDPLGQMTKVREIRRQYEQPYKPGGDSGRVGVRMSRSSTARARRVTACPRSASSPRTTGSSSTRRPAPTGLFGGRCTALSFWPRNSHRAST